MTNKQLWLLVRVLIAGFNSVCETIIRAVNAQSNTNPIGFETLFSEQAFLTEGEIREMENA